uniref:Uncharacterized protein n=1 Tax=Trichogramma kaykai TaxID=54128 RepID=A0ABD2WJ55_9HYME
MSVSSDDVYTSVYAFVGEVHSKSLKTLREKVNWQVEDERRTFLYWLYYVFRDWEGELPDLLEIFSEEEIDWILVESVIDTYGAFTYNQRTYLIKFIARTGLTHNPELDEEGKPILNRTTPIHHAARRQPFNYGTIIREFFKIFDRFDVNYVDEDGLTHFHVACEFGLCDIVEQFLEIGQNPNCLVPLTGNSPLHLALYRGQYFVAGVLLRNGADINLANRAGSTALHIACLNCHSHLLVKMALRMYDDRNETVQVDALDNLGRTPLQWAVANLLPDMVDILLDHGADLSSFVFPTEDYFAERFKSQNTKSVNFELRLATGALIVVECLEKRGYELELREALVVMKLFAEYGLFEKSDDAGDFWYKDEEFARKAKQIMMKSEMSLYEAILLSPEEAAKLIKCWDYFRFARSEKLLDLPWRSRAICFLCEKMSRRFFRDWALECFAELTQLRLTLDCSEIVIEKLMNEDLYRICLSIKGLKL